MSDSTVTSLHYKQSRKPLILDQEKQCRSFGLHSMGGVGKTQIALQCANSNRGSFNAILWISADNTIRMAQSFLEVARRLCLFPENEEARMLSLLCLE